jgi:O-antigen ligase
LQETEGTQKISSLRPEMMCFILYLFIVFFAPQERYNWMVDFRPALSIAILTLFFCLISNKRNYVTTNKKSVYRILIFLFVIFVFCFNYFAPMSDKIFSEGLINIIKASLLFFVVTMVVKNEFDLNLLIKTIMIFGAFISVYSILAYKFGWGDLHYRMRSPFGGMGSNSNGYAMFLLALLPFYVVSIKIEISLFKKILNIIIVLVILMCIIKTRSRMGALGAMIICLIIVWENKTNIRLLLLLTIICTLMIVRANENFWERVITIPEDIQAEQIDIYSTYRRNKWRQAITLSKMYPITGVGLMMFRKAIRTHKLGEDELIVHNGYLEICVESGIVSMGIYLVIILYTILKNRALMIFFSNIENKKMSMLSGALCMSFIVISFCLVFLSEQYNSIIFILLGTSAALGKFSTNFNFENTV